jgi:hypothetical protein
VSSSFEYTDFSTTSILGNVMLLATFILQALLLVPVRGDYYVAVNGNDFGPGSATAPFRTLERAQAAVRRSTSGMKSDLYIYVGPGTYYLNEPLKFTSEDSGQNGHRVVWQAQDMTKGANISGG